MKQDLLNSLGSQVRALRLGQGMTQQELAERCELSLPFINLIENNKRNVSLETLVKLLSALNISLSEFFEPFSHGEDEGLTAFLLLLQQSPKKDKYIKLFTQVLELSEE
ncbi:helix-turn-helix domain-containing protein [Vagococcus sp. PNs007]|uniref:Helix-turn-helix domain-containing protein n=1 Tax=Vagococcus proximus TaxID=2991417 RepID=A0ABT5X0Y7_9ENTE|nr:helix-turn-helix transcriptional regulator [Vagococcus proximus]MDF0479662.1 helix-turn-helix domain-containing protein [Vagococcus proximus]